MSLFSWLSNNTKAVDDVLDKDSGLLAKAGGWFDRLSYTDEEQAEAKAKRLSAYTNWFETTLSENTERSKTRRKVAVDWIRVQLFLILLTAITIFWDEEKAQSLFELATSQLMVWGTGSIIVFFFGGYVWGNYIAKPKNPAAKATHD